MVPNRKDRHGAELSRSIQQRSQDRHGAESSRSSTSNWRGRLRAPLLHFPFPFLPFGRQAGPFTPIVISYWQMSHYHYFLGKRSFRPSRPVESILVPSPDHPPNSASRLGPLILKGPSNRELLEGRRGKDDAHTCWIPFFFTGPPNSVTPILDGDLPPSSLAFFCLVSFCFTTLPAYCTYFFHFGFAFLLPFLPLSH